MTSTIDKLVLMEFFREIRGEMRDQRALLLEMIDRGRSLERKVDTQLLAIDRRLVELGGEIKDDLELTLRSELMGIVGDLESRGSNG